MRGYVVDIEKVTKKIKTSAKIVLFLKTTTGVQPKVEYPILPFPAESAPKPKL